MMKSDVMKSLCLYLVGLTFGLKTGKSSHVRSTFSLISLSKKVFLSGLSGGF